MTVEEKAKLYDEALEIAKKNYDTVQDLCEGSRIDAECFKNILESMFPKLKESIIREELTEFLKNASEGLLDSTIQCKTFGKWYAWFKKQGKDEEIHNFDVLPGLYKCVDRMCDGTPDSKGVFEEGHIYKCLAKCNRSVFETYNGHTAYIDDSTVRQHFIPLENQGEPKEE